MTVFMKPIKLAGKPVTDNRRQFQPQANPIKAAQFAHRRPSGWIGCKESHSACLATKVCAAYI